MKDRMNELIQFSPLAGKLVLEKVAGDTRARHEFENQADAGVGEERSMYVYAPKSGCPAAKQCQVLMVLRDEESEASAELIMKQWELDQLAEQRNFLLLFPNPQAGGWNYQEDPGRENDMDFLIRCFAVLKGSKVGIGGFNGMTFYLASSPSAGAMLATFAARKPLNVPAIMVGELPDNYRIPSDAVNAPVAAWSAAPVLTEYLMRVNCVEEKPCRVDCGVASYRSKENPAVRLLVGQGAIDKEAVSQAWELLFSETRRWQNDTYGTYQVRTDFTQRGFVAHVKDTSLGCNHARPQTWYEYVPPRLRNTTERVPLVFYFHGGGCVPLYGAEQSGWHDIADQEGFIVVYPEASENFVWNVWDDPAKPSDEAFFVALLEHMKKTYPIDESRVYLSGFSMGGMMTHAMACAHPDLIAAANPCNAYHSGYFASFESLSRRMKHGGNLVSTIWDDPDQLPSALRLAADQKNASYDYRVPVFQVSGLLDQEWPIPDRLDERINTFDYWKAYNHIPVSEYVQDASNPSGLTSDEAFYEGEDQRFFHQRFLSEDPKGVSLLELFLAKRMPHAVDLRSFHYAWAYLKGFSRNSDGSLNIL